MSRRRGGEIPYQRFMRRRESHLMRREDLKLCRSLSLATTPEDSRAVTSGTLLEFSHMIYGDEDDVREREKSFQLMLIMSEDIEKHN